MNSNGVNGVTLLAKGTDAGHDGGLIWTNGDVSAQDRFCLRGTCISSWPSGSGGGMPNCGSNESGKIPKWSGSFWYCAVDETGSSSSSSSGTSNIDQVLALGGSSSHLLHLTDPGNSNVLQVDGYAWFTKQVTIDGTNGALCMNDVPGGTKTCKNAWSQIGASSTGGTVMPTCTNDQVAKWNNGWSCGTDNTSSGGGSLPPNAVRYFSITLHGGYTFAGDALCSDHGGLYCVQSQVNTDVYSDSGQVYPHVCGDRVSPTDFPQTGGGSGQESYNGAIYAPIRLQVSCVDPSGL